MADAAFELGMGSGSLAAVGGMVPGNEHCAYNSLMSDYTMLLKKESIERLNMVKQYMLLAAGLPPNGMQLPSLPASAFPTWPPLVVDMPNAMNPALQPGALLMPLEPMKVSFPIGERESERSQISKDEEKKQVLSLSQLLGASEPKTGFAWSSAESTASCIGMSESLSETSSESPKTSLDTSSVASWSFAETSKPVKTLPPGLMPPPGLEEPTLVPKASWPPAAPADADGPVTSLMIRNIPCRISRQQLIDTINEMGFSGTFDFLYIPTGGRPTAAGACPNRGYGFINFLNGDDASRFTAVFSGYRFDGTLSNKACEVEPAQLQGLANNIRGIGGRSAAKRRSRGRLDAVTMPAGN